MAAMVIGGRRRRSSVRKASKTRSLRLRKRSGRGTQRRSRRSSRRRSSYGGFPVGAL
jgi:hypothetical protein